MSASTPIGEWGSALRGLAVGMSIASLVLLPTSNHNTVAVQEPRVTQHVESVGTVADGSSGLQLLYVRTQHGLVQPSVGSRVDVSQDDVAASLASTLRDISGLPIDELRRAIPVSRMTYHNWLSGEGMRPQHMARVSKLIATFRTLRDILGDQIAAFVRSSTPAGKPLDLLAHGNDAAVIGLALRPVPRPGSLSPVSAQARQASGLPDWLGQPRPLPWAAPTLPAGELWEAMDRLSPAPVFASSMSTEDDGT